MKLNIGCGNDIRVGYVNLDYHAGNGVNVVHDLSKIPYPFKNNAFDEIYASHILEHIDCPIDKVMQELHRILAKDGKLIIREPHYTSPSAHDPFHKTYWHSDIFDAFITNPKRQRLSKDFGHGYFYQESLRIVFAKGKLFYNYVMEPLANINPLVYEATPMSVFPALEIKVVLVKK